VNVDALGGKAESLTNNGADITVIELYAFEIPSSTSCTQFGYIIKLQIVRFLFLNMANVPSPQPTSSFLPSSLRQHLP
jgi:hypothetical protein